MFYMLIITSYYLQIFNEKFSFYLNHKSLNNVRKLSLQVETVFSFSNFISNFFADRVGFRFLIFRIFCNMETTRKSAMLKILQDYVPLWRHEKCMLLCKVNILHKFSKPNLNRLKFWILLDFADLYWLSVSQKTLNMFA